MGDTQPFVIADSDEEELAYMRTKGTTFPSEDSDDVTDGWVPPVQLPLFSFLAQLTWLTAFAGSRKPSQKDGLRRLDVKSESQQANRGRLQREIEHLADRRHHVGSRHSARPAPSSARSVLSKLPPL